MVKRTGGPRRKTRDIFSKKPNQRGKYSLTKYFQVFKEGERVQLKAEPAIHTGLYFRRFNTRSGIITRKQGRCYVVEVKDGGKVKNIIVHPIHLKRY